MNVYHMSDTLQLGMELSTHYKNDWALTQPFVQALEKSEDCFYGAYFAAKWANEALERFGMAGMQTDYVKWAAEGIFEFVRRREFPRCVGRQQACYYFDSLDACRELFAIDWGRASEEERAKIRLFEVALDDPNPERHDMRLFDRAYDGLCENDDLAEAVECARLYFSGGQSERPIWEIVSGAHAVAVRERTDWLR